jgi:predicted esterase
VIALSRRAFLAAVPGAIAPKPESTAGFDVLELPLPKRRGMGKSALVMMPHRPAARGSLPILIALHGLGETRDERAGLFAWQKRYGLARAWERLESPPLAREQRDYVSEAEYALLNQSLARNPFAGFLVVCPFMPNPYTGDASTRLERYAETLTRDLLPAVREQVPAASPDPRCTGIAGVSLGGAVALEVFVRRPREFGTLGIVQGAFGTSLSKMFARRIVEADNPAGRAVYVSTSRGDPYRAANQRLARELGALGVPTRFSERKGPHSQDWLIEIGSLELLLWHDQALRGRPEQGSVGPS